MSVFSGLGSCDLAVPAFFLVLFFLLGNWLWVKSRKLPLPPGPSGNLIFGNTIPVAFSYLYFEKLAQQYGPVFSLRQGLQTIVVVGRFDAAVEILEKKGCATADRPRSIASGEVLSGGLRALFVPAGDKLKKMRRAFHSHLNPQILWASPSMHMRNARNFILDIVDSQDKYYQHAIKFSASTLMNMAYGTKIESDHDPWIRWMRKCLARLGESFRPGYWKVDIYPFLQYIPGYLTPLEEGHRDERNLFTSLLFKVKDQMKLQTPETEITPSFARYLLERKDTLGLSDEEMAYMAGSLFGGGTNTTAATIGWGIMAAALHPEAQEKVWEEIDRVVGRDRPPTFADQKSLVWVTAWVLEVMRWRPVSAGGFPHKATEDIVWNGYLIPKGATIYGNVWSVNRDPAYYPNPERFDPARWVDKDGAIRNDLRAFSFGFGRRVCPGQHFANGSLFLCHALLLWSFKIKEDPNCRINEWGMTEGLNSHPKPFKVIFEPRFASTLADVKTLYHDYCS